VGLRWSLSLFLPVLEQSNKPCGSSDPSCRERMRGSKTNWQSRGSRRQAAATEAGTGEGGSRVVRLSTLFELLSGAPGVLIQGQARSCLGLGLNVRGRGRAPWAQL
ncbi:c0f0f460-7d88-434e-bc0b-18f3145ce43f, partial [Thermothielavioides terrestris]